MNDVLIETINDITYSFLILYNITNIMFQHISHS